jgi:hypothetical protein
MAHATHLKKISVFASGVFAVLFLLVGSAHAADSISMGVQTQAGTITNICISFGSGAAAKVTVNGAQMGYYDVAGANTNRCFDTSVSFNSGDDIETVSANGPYVGFISATGTLVAPTCSPSTITNGTIGAYPGCAVSCNSGYTLSGGSCVATGGGGSSNPQNNYNIMGITLATGTAAMFLANAASTVGDPGVLEIVALAVGIPLAFYILHQLIGLVPKGKSGRRS